MISRLLLGAREVDEEVQAASQQRLGELARAVRGEHARPGRSRARIVPSSGTVTWKSLSTSSRNASNSWSALSISSISSTTRARRGDGAQQRALEEVVAREDVVLDVVPRPSLGAVGLDAQQLLLVVPLVERARLVEPLVALEADQLGVEHASPAPCRARSCRRRPGPRRGAASRARAPGRARSRRAAW